MKNNTFYAVQVGNDYGWDYGSRTYEEALAMAKREVENPDNAGMEIRIAYIDEKYGVCDKADVVREGITFEEMEEDFEIMEAAVKAELEEAARVEEAETVREGAF